MNAPLILIFTATIKDGHVEGFKEYAREHAEFVEANHPDLLAFHTYLSEDGRTVSVVQVHPDAASLEFQMTDIVPEHSVKAYQYLEEGSERSQTYGTLSEAIAAGFAQYGVAVNANPDHLGGFTRLQSS